MAEPRPHARLERIRARLEQRFAPTALEVIDESHLHAGHPGARSGKGHFRVRIVAPAFAGLPSLRRHRLVYESLEELMTQDIHALSIEALAPTETLESTT
ncbi:MAG TPA: BolA family protein [Steroidobacteraceae bacterium]|nr:BolA family protein [Steroidobacteraceae bacterium]